MSATAIDRAAYFSKLHGTLGASRLERLLARWFGHPFRTVTLDGYEVAGSYWRGKLYIAKADGPSVPIIEGNK